MLQWDRAGVSWRKIGTRIAKDGGRYAMIVTYKYSARGDQWRALVAAVERPGIDIEGAFGPRDKRPGRAYLAVAHEITVADVMKRLRAAGVDYRFRLAHPKPSKRKAKRASLRSRSP